MSEFRAEVAAWADQVEDIVTELRSRRYKNLQIQKLIRHLDESRAQLRNLHYALRLGDPSAVYEADEELPVDPRPTDVIRAELRARFGIDN